MKTLIPLATASSPDAFGGKTARLASAMEAGFAVPDGFAISVQTVSLLRQGEKQTAEELREDLHGFVGLQIPGALFAVRSSGVAEDGELNSFAGIYETVLNIPAEVEQLLAAIHRCIEAGGTQRFDEYRAMANSVRSDGLALLIQCMVPAEVAGVAFSQAYGPRGEYVLIEAVEGLGEALVSGATTPSRYVVPLPVAEKASRQGFLVQGNNALGSHVHAVAQLARRAAQHFGAPQDIEWAVVNNELWLLQSRPITVPVEVDDNVAFRGSGSLLSGFGASPGRATGAVNVMRDSDSPFSPGSILVAVNTDTDFLPAMRKASGFVTEEGGLLSHASLVARELGLPCVVGVPRAASVLEDGQIVTIDGSTGIVYEGDAQDDPTCAPFAYDLTGLYCFDTAQEIDVEGQRVLIEPSSNGYAAWLPPHVDTVERLRYAASVSAKLNAPIQLPVSDKYPIYLAYNRRMSESPIFRENFEALLATTWTLDPERLRYELQKLNEQSKAWIAASFNESDPLVLYALLDSVGGNYLLSNTLLPEGYGARAVYRAVSPLASSLDRGIGEYLVDPERADELPLLYYRVLADVRESSYPTYVEFGGADDIFYDRLNAARDALLGGEVDSSSVPWQDIIAATLASRPEVWRLVRGSL